MVNSIILCLIILVSFALGSFTTVKAIQIGLRWKMQVENKQEPILKPVVTPKTPEQKNEYTKEILNEWMYGEGV